MLSIVRECLAPVAVARVVADRHGIGARLLYGRRNQMLRAAMTGFVAVEIRPEALLAPQTAADTADDHASSMSKLQLEWSTAATAAETLPGCPA